MTEAIILPGIGNSDEAHWQSYWEKNDHGMRRFSPASWHKPVLSDWMETLENEVSLCRTRPFLIAHSLACLLVAHWAFQTQHAIRGAFLVAVPNPANPVFPKSASSFAGFPQKKLPFPTLIVASTDDPYANANFSRTVADAWQAGCILLDEHGHISSSSQLGEWHEGNRYYEAFKAGTHTWTPSAVDLSNF